LLLYIALNTESFPTEHIIEEGKTDLFSSEVVLHRFTGGSVAEGSYAFPFEVAIPPGLPGSQIVRSDDSFWGINYCIEAKLHRTGISAWEFKNSCEVLLNDELYDTIPVPLFLGPCTSRVSCLMELLPRGTLTFGGKVHSNACGNETLRVNYAIHNESTAGVRYRNESGWTRLHQHGFHLL
jgi:hypothetical protein